jgi:hypothetical protein
VRTKKGNLLHSKGKKLPFSDVEAQAPIGYARAIGEALRGNTSAGGVSAKVIMRWTGASERSVKGWISGRQGPSGEHLIALMQQSDAVWLAVVRLAGRHRADADRAIGTVRQHLAEAERLLAMFEGGSPR